MTASGRSSQAGVGQQRVEAGHRIPRTHCPQPVIQADGADLRMVAVRRRQRDAARPCWLSLARQQSQPKLSCQTEIWTGRVQDDGFGELGMEVKPVSIDPTVNKVEEAEDRTPDGLASGRPAKPGPGGVSGFLCVRRL
jgi:hypothetical protein